MIKQPYIHNFSYLFTAFLFILFTCNPVTIQLVDRNVIYNPLMPLVMNPKILVVTLPYNGMDQDLNWFFKLRTDYSVQSSESFKYLDQSPRPNSTDLSIIKLIYPWVSQSRWSFNRLTFGFTYLKSSSRVSCIEKRRLSHHSRIAIWILNYNYCYFQFHFAMYVHIR